MARGVTEPTVLSRKGVVYVRLSTQTQVHLESQRRQYDLVDEARRHGFRNVEVIDDELGPFCQRIRSASGFREARRRALCRRGSALCFGSTPPVSPATAGTSIICSSCCLVDTRVINPMVCTIRVVRMTVYFWR